MSAADVLVVEDDGDISDVTASCLEDHGYCVVTAANGQEALERLRSMPALPRLILLDLMMPVMDGWQFRALQAADPRIADIPVVLMSAHVDVRDVAAHLGTAGWLRKPFELRDLLAAVQHAGAEATPAQ
jgi:CheY-like chemotaxis protein